jgi:hypothetical protein
MAVEGWPLAAAREEMRAFGFWSGWHDLLRYVERFPQRQDQIWPANR